MKLVLRNVNGETITLNVMPGDTFRDVKTRMHKKSGILLDLEQLKYKGRKITDDQVITQYFADDPSDPSDDAAESTAETSTEDFLDSTLMVTCSVPGCSSSALTSPGKTFFTFPSETNRCQHWLLLCKRLDLLDKPTSYVSQRHVICHDHFVVDQLVPTPDGFKLKNGALPTIIEADYLVDSTTNENDEFVSEEINYTMPIKTEQSFEYYSEDDNIVSDLEDICEASSHPGLLCRLCAGEIGDMVETGEIVYIFSSAAKDQDIAHKINMSLPVTVKSTDPLPKQLCMPCLEKLNICHEFAESCLLAEKKLCHMNKERIFKGCSITGKENAGDTSENAAIKPFNETNIDASTKNALCYSCPLCCDGNMANPKESSESDIVGEIQKMDGIINTYRQTSEDGPYDNHSIHNTNAGEMFGLPTDTLYRHRATHVELKPFQCDKCGRCFARKALFNQHSLVHLTDVTTKQQRTCKICGEVVIGAYIKMLEHRRLNHPGVLIKDEETPLTSSKPFQCNECGKSFAYRVTLVAHMRKHTGELPFDCQYCEKKFSQKRSLVLHERTHTGEKPYECETCGKRFSQSAHMYSHLRLHTGEKPYSCPSCPSTFRLKDVRDAHLRKHTGERPYKCGVCEKAFRTSHSYYQHMWIHQGKKPYPCEYCGKAFRRSNGLKIHIRIHTGEKPHCCEVCGRGFAQKQDMKKHLNLHLNGSVFRKKEPINQEKPALMIVQ